MFKMLLQFLLLVPVAIMSVNISGCVNQILTGQLNIETVHEIFPSATGISEISISRDVQISERPGSLIINEIRNASGLLGYCVESEPVSRSGPFKIRVFLDQQLVVKLAIVISYPWERGREVRKRAFTSQFEGKGPGDTIEIGKDIDAMTGATISCRAMAQCVRQTVEFLAVWHQPQLDKRHRTHESSQES
jgi:Na+-translocating ferredoxin:NAD+ oxidoreductase RnfG subunit